MPMDPELRDLLVRIDERTASTNRRMDELATSFSLHEARDREDFKEVHDRITLQGTALVDRIGKVSRFVNIGSGILSCAAFMMGLFWPGIRDLPWFNK